MMDGPAADFWRYGRLLRAAPGGAPKEDCGYQWRGLSLCHSGWANPRSETRWSLVHMGSGGVLMRFTGTVSVVMPAATEIAQCSDWTLFDLPDGWKQTDPDLPAKVGAICKANPEARPEAVPEAAQISAEDARAVIEAREAVPAGAPDTPATRAPQETPLNPQIP